MTGMCTIILLIEETKPAVKTLVKNNPRDTDMEAKETGDGASPVTCCIDSRQVPNMSGRAGPPEHRGNERPQPLCNILFLFFLASFPISISGQQSWL